MPDAPLKLTEALSDRYAIERELGAGGMATVYLAQDLKHDRKVAVKVLRPELGAVIGAERFLSEIKTTANLQHPHILGLIDSGDADGLLYYVMPYVQGETVRDRLEREKQLPVADAVRIATEVASALDYAHRHGVIHRDIKPENILLHDGSALVADFGIALAASKAGGTRMTETGMSLGTPHYMSPEQAMGEREITARSDVYALGAVLYEMLLGEPPFTGPTAQAIVAKVVTEKPASLVGRRDRVPPEVEEAVLTALEKLPADRFASAAEFAQALGGARTPSLTTRTARAPARPARGPVEYAGWALWALTLLVGAWYARRVADRPPPPVRRYGLDLGSDVGVTANSWAAMAIRPDGQMFAYVGKGAGDALQIWVRDRSELNGRVLPGTTGAHDLSWSPDGRQLAFVTSAAELKTIALDGAAPVTVADTLINGGGTAWGPNGMLYSSGIGRAVGVGGPAGLVRVPVAGGVPEQFTTMDSSRREFAHLNPAILPGGKALVFTIWYGPTRATDADIAVADLATGAHRVLLRGVRAKYLPTGHLLVVRSDGGMVVVPFDVGRLEVTGAPVPVATGVAVRNGYAVDLDVADDGTLVYYAGEPRGVREKVEPVWVTRGGQATPVDSGWTFERPFNGGVSLSPDGTRLAVAIAGEPWPDIWVKQLDRGPLTRLSFEPYLKNRPVWTPDGASVTYLTDPGNNDALIVSRRADGSGGLDTLAGSRHLFAEVLWTPDGKMLVVRTTIPSRDIRTFRPGVDTAAVPLLANQGYDERAPTLSPDGRWMAYESNESGRDEIYVRPFPNVEAGRWQVSTQGASEPRWSRDGREIFFRSAEEVMTAVPVTTTPAFSVGAAQPLFSTKGYARALSYRAYDAAADGQRFVLLRLDADSAAAAAGRMVFVDNWFEELRAKLGGR